MKILRFIIILFISVSILFNIVCADVLISELMVCSDTAGEWIELFNNGTVKCDISGYSLTDNSRTIFLDSKSIVIQEKDFIIIVSDSVKFKKAYPFVNCNIIEPAGWISLNNTGDVVVLKNTFGVVEDSVCYGVCENSGSFFPKNISLERKTDDKKLYLSNNKNGCTPGFYNSVNQTISGDFSIKAGPKIFRPGEGEFYTINVSAIGRYDLQVDIFSIDGQNIKKIFFGSSFGQKQFLWNGRNNSYNIVKRGTYILWVSYNNGSKVFKKILVVAPGR